MTGVWMTCVLVADVSEATWCWAGCGPGWSNACVFCRRGCQMSLMCNLLSCGTVLCCRISMASRTCLVCQCGMDVMGLLSSQLILCCCCCCACFTMADLSPSPRGWQALCSLTRCRHQRYQRAAPYVTRGLFWTNWFYSDGCYSGSQESEIEIAPSTVHMHPSFIFWSTSKLPERILCERITTNWQGRNNYNVKTGLISK